MHQRVKSFALILAIHLCVSYEASAEPPVSVSTVGSGFGGFVVNNFEQNANLGRSVSDAGDVNGDNIPDVIIGAWRASPGGDNFAGAAYVVFGKTSGTAVSITNIDAGTGGGFAIHGIDADDNAGISVSGAGDVNNDGFDDVIVGASDADPNANDYAGEAYVVFGKATTTAVELSDVASGTGGFIMTGIAASDRAGFSVSGAGDVNNDNLADVIVGAFGAGNTAQGQAYVVFGKTTTTAVPLADIVSGTGGFVLDGSGVITGHGQSVSDAGDVNDDGFDDVICLNRVGQAFVVFGKASTTAVSLADVYSGTGGFAIDGIPPSTSITGYSVSRAGDVNNDGFADVIVGTMYTVEGPPELDNKGVSYVVFGKSTTTLVDLDTLDAEGGGGFVIHGIAPGDYTGNSVSDAGDVNGDGLADVIVDAWGTDPAGASYVVYGKTNGAAVELSSVLAGSGGFAIIGGGYSVSGVGDMNGDGLADVIVGAHGSDAGMTSGAGRTYIIFSPVTASWVDFAFTGTELGTESQPFNTLGEGLQPFETFNVVGTVNVKGDTADNDSAEIITIRKHVQIVAVNGAIRVGEPGARNTGFITRVPR